MSKQFPVLRLSSDCRAHVSYEAIDPNDCGGKAIGLTQLPDPWGAPWVAVPISACTTANLESRWVEIAECLVDHFSAKNPNGACGLIVRSSAPDEDLDKRGQLDSVRCESAVDSLAQALKAVALQLREHEPEPASIACAVVIQPFIDADYRGHLSNEYRHAQRSVDFLYESERLAVTDAPAEPPRSFRLPRPVAAPGDRVLGRPLLVTGASEIEQRLKVVGAWLAARNIRGHIEWLATSDQLLLVQLDIDPLPTKHLPMSEAPIYSRMEPDLNRLGNAFVPVGSRDFSGLRKTRSHALLQAAGAAVPRIFVALNVGSQFEDPHSRFWHELGYLLSTPSIIRFDVPLTRLGWTNLPTIGPLTTDDDFQRKVLAAIEIIASRGVDLNEVAVVVHQFIAARAAAWSEASPTHSQIRIDAIWGLPDGLQSFAHDSILYDAQTGTFTPQVRYKDRFLDVGRSGGWIVRRAAPSLAREDVCKLPDIKSIAEVSARVAQHAERAVRIMWFLDVLTGAGSETPSAMPWIVVELEEDTRPTMPQHRSLAARDVLKRQVDLHSDRRVQNRASLARFRRNPGAMDIGARHVLLQPDAVTVRDRTFLDDFAQAVKALAGQWKVLYAGSMLAHAPYQLQELGISVLALHQEVRPPRRTYLQKLVRDGIPARIAAGGEHAEVIHLEDHEFQLALRQKLVEEALEVGYSADSDELREELADLLGVAQALWEATTGGLWSEVERAAAEKTERRGGFQARLFLRSTGFNEQTNPVRPGGAGVNRLRDGKGVRVGLVPPLLSGERNTTVELQRLGVRVQVRFDEQEVYVRLNPSTQTRQLDLFDITDEKDAER